MTKTTWRALLAAQLSVILLGAAAMGWTAGQEEERAKAALTGIAAGDHRATAHRARDRYRHPVETLSWFGIRQDMTVVEVSPGGAGWYTEFLAPFLKGRGKLYAAGYNPEAKMAYFRRNARRFTDKLAADPDNYYEVTVTVLQPPDELGLAPDGVADMVVSFRNLHNWMGNGQAESVLAAIYTTLKPGGVFGLVQHRGDPAVKQDPGAESGYVRQDYAIAMAEAVGFRFVAASEINANPADTRGHPEGVWTLPPVLRLGDDDRDKYLAIGESDRMTLKFVKPAESR